MKLFTVPGHFSDRAIFWQTFPRSDISRHWTFPRLLKSVFTLEYFKVVIQTSVFFFYSVIFFMSNNFCEWRRHLNFTIEIMPKTTSRLHVCVESYAFPVNENIGIIFSITKAASVAATQRHQKQLLFYKLPHDWSATESLKNKNKNKNQRRNTF